VRFTSPKNSGIVAEPGALIQWWDEIRRGKRNRQQSDALWLAACHEANARDALRIGAVAAANHFRKVAASVIVAAVVGTRR
jgi:hypothetical protein